MYVEFAAGLQSEFQENQAYTEKLGLEKPKANNERKKRKWNGLITQEQ